MAYPNLATINKNIYSNSTPKKGYSKELQRRQNLANWGQLRDAYQAANWTKQYDTQQMQQNAYGNAYNTGNTRGSYVNQALASGAAPINQNYNQAMQGVGNQETALNDAAWAQAHAPKGGGGGGTIVTDPYTGKKYANYTALLKDRYDTSQRNARTQGSASDATLDEQLKYATSHTPVRGQYGPPGR